MRKFTPGHVILILCAALAFVGGCGKVEEFDTSDIAITGHSASIDGTDLTWSITLSSASDYAVDVETKIELNTPGSSTYFYTSPTHSETLGANETKTFTYTESGVSLPSETSGFEYKVTRTAVPD